ncbi:MAG: glutathione S-transferase family protein [Cellvibrionaceae bacterium]
MLTLYGSNISYFTGKLENYFRLKNIPYRLHSMQAPRDFKRVERAVGVSQMPALQLADGRWMTDSTKIIQWFEQELDQPSIIPQDPVLRYLCLLLEDYADEWLWRPAMHYRWHYSEGAHFASRHLADELMGAMPLPGGLKRLMMRHRQRSGYTTGDGITADNVPAVETIYGQLLDHLQCIFSKQKFLLGDSPSLADIGFSGPFFRHFALDPVPLEILRNRAPAVLEWVARLWQAQVEPGQQQYGREAIERLEPLLKDIGQSYLPYLNANVDAVESGRKRFDVSISGADYRGARVSQYRVWCLQQLRDHFDETAETDQATLKALLESHGCWQPLWEKQHLPMANDQECHLPFQADHKMIAANE